MEEAAALFDQHWSMGEAFHLAPSEVVVAIASCYTCHLAPDTIACPPDSHLAHS